MAMEGTLTGNPDSAAVKKNQVARFRKNLRVVATLYDDTINVYRNERKCWSSPVRQAALELHQALDITQNYDAETIKDLAAQAWDKALTCERCLMVQGARHRQTVRVSLLPRDEGQSSRSMNEYVRPEYDKKIEAAWDATLEGKELSTERARVSSRAQWDR